MKWLVYGALALICATTSAASRDEEFREGTLIFLTNCNSIVERTTHGEIGHVALVFPDGDVTWVYEATPSKVRRVTLDAYFEELARLNKGHADDEAIHVLALHPREAYSAGQVAAMREFLDAQLGRRYSVKNYVRGRSYDGIHCAELASSTLNRSGRYEFRECHKFNPHAFYSAVLPSHASPQRLDIPAASKESWSARACRRWSAAFVWCSWSCKELWLWCW